VLSLLVPAFSLERAPPVLPLRLHGAPDAPLPIALRRSRSFGGVFEPPYIVRARSHSASKLLRTF
jgi:hypothetical protein